MEVEPYPIENGELWDDSSPQWLARFEYIEQRAERFFEFYRDSPEYDFTRIHAGVRSQQKATQDAYYRFARGALMLLGVEAQCKMLRDAFKKKEATKPTPEERAAQVKQTEYVPQWRKDWEAKKERKREQALEVQRSSQPSKDSTAFIVRRGYYGKHEVTPMPGLACYSIDQDEGYTETGERVDKGRGYILVLWDCHESFYPDKPGRPAMLIPGYEPEVSGPVQTKTLDDLRQEQEDSKHKESLEQLDRRLSRLPKRK